MVQGTSVDAMPFMLLTFVFQVRLQGVSLTVSTASASVACPERTAAPTSPLRAR